MENPEILIAGGILLFCGAVYLRLVHTSPHGQSTRRKTRYVVGVVSVLVLAGGVVVLDHDGRVPAWYWYRQGRELVEQQPPDDDAALRAFGRARLLDPNHAPARLEMAGVYYRQGLGWVSQQPPDYDAALEAFKRAKSLDPNHIPAGLEMSMIHFIRNEFGDAEVGLISTLELAPDHAKALFLLGRVKLAQSEWKSAVRKFSQALLAGHDAAECYFRRATAYEHYDPSLALDDYERATKARKGFTDAHHSRGTLYFRIGEFKKAVAELTAAIKSRPRELMLRLARARAYLGLEKFEDAIRDYSLALELLPKDSRLWFESAVCRIKANDLSGAIRDLDRAVQIDDRYVDAYIQRLLLRKATDDVIGDATRVLELQPENHKARLLRGQARLLAGKYAAAIDDLTWCVKAGKISSPVFRARGRAYFAMKCFQEALNDFSSALKDKSTDAVDIHVISAECRIRLNDVLGAIRDLTAALQLDDRHVIARLKRAQLHFQTRDLPKAIADADRVLELDRGCFEAISLRGRARQEIGKYENAIADLTRCIKAGQATSSDLIARARSCFALKRFKKADKDYSAALKLEPDDAVRLYRELAECCVKLNDPHRAIRNLGSAIRLDDGCVWSYVRRGQLRLVTNAWLDVIRDANRIMEIEPTNLDAFFLRGRARQLLGQYDDAVRDLSRSIDLGNKSTTVFLFRGESLLTLEKYEEAIADFSVVIHNAPVPFTALVGRARAFEKLGNRKLAIRDLSRAITADTSKSGPFFRRGLLHSQEKEFPEAIRDFTAALKLAGSNIDIKFHRALARAASNDHRGAVDDFTDVLKTKPRALKSLLGRAKSWATLKDHDKAIADWTAALEVDRHSRKARLGRGQSFLAAKKFDRAIQDFNQAWGADPSAQDQIRSAFAEAHFGKAKARLEAGQHDEAANGFGRVIEIDPEFARKVRIHKLLAKASLQKARQWQRSNDEQSVLKAIEAYDRAISFDVELIAARYERALAYLGLGNLPEALDDFNEVLRREPTHVMARIGRGKIYARQRNFQKAIATFTSVLEDAPDSVEALSGRGEVYLEIQNYSAAIVDFSRLLKAKGADIQQARWQIARSHFHRGLQLLNDERFAEAIDYLDDALRFDSKIRARVRIPLAKAHVGRAGELRKLGNFVSAIVHLSRVLVLNPDDIEALLQRARSYRRLPRIDLLSALRDYQRILALDPGAVDKVDALIGKGEVETESGKLIAAISSFGEAISIAVETTLHERLSAAFLGRGRTLNLLPTPTDEQLKRCIKDFHEAITNSPGTLEQDIAPEYGNAYLRLGLRYFKSLKSPLENRESHRELLDRAVTALETARRISSTLSNKVKRPLADVHGMRGDYYLTSGEYTLAIDDYREAISTDRSVGTKVNKQLARSFFMRGLEHYMKGRWTLAIKDLDEAVVGLDCRQLRAAARVRFALVRTGRDAVKLLQSALKIYGKLPETQKLLDLLHSLEKTSTIDKVWSELAAEVTRAHQKPAAPILIKPTNPNTAANLSRRLGAALGKLRARDWGTAVDIYTEVADQSWSIANCYYGRGIAYLYLGENERARADLELASFLEFAAGGDRQFGFYFIFVQGSVRLEVEEFRKRGGHRYSLKQQEREKKWIDQIDAVREEIDTVWDAQTILPNDTRKEENKSRSRISSHRIRRRNTVSAETGSVTRTSVPAALPAIAVPPGGDLLGRARNPWPRILSERGRRRRAVRPAASRPCGS